MDMMKLAGINKGYDKTLTTFTKMGMWPERYFAEISGIRFASESGIKTPTIINAALGDLGGIIVMNRIYKPRLDQVLWGNYNPEVFDHLGKILARIHSVKLGDNVPSFKLMTRRFHDLEKDILAGSYLPHHMVDVAFNSFKFAFDVMKNDSACLLHGDYTIQNIFFGEDDIIVFDWEHSCFSSKLYDIGTFLSFAILLVLDGGWSFSEYFCAMRRFMDSYQSLLPLNSKEKMVVELLRFLGHRQISQYYLFVLEYAAFVQGDKVCLSILNGDRVFNPLSKLADIGIKFNPVSGGSLIRAIDRGQYQFSKDFWETYQKEIKT